MTDRELVNCEWCGKPFWKKTSGYGQNAKYCSDKCRLEVIKKNNREYARKQQAAKKLKLKERGIKTEREISRFLCGHHDCKWRGSIGNGTTSSCCDYLILTGHSRGCPPTPDCEHYVKGRKRWNGRGGVEVFDE